MADRDESKAEEYADRADTKRSSGAGRVSGLEAGGLNHTWNDWVEPDRKGNFYGAFQATRNQG